MKHISKLLIVGACLTGCAVQSPDPWAQLEPDETPSVKPFPLPDRCVPVEIDGNYVIDRSFVNCLDDYYTISEGNTDIASALAGQVDALKQANNELIQAGQAQRRVADIRQQIIEEERRSHFIQSIALWTGMIIAAGAATGL